MSASTFSKFKWVVKVDQVKFEGNEIALGELKKLMMANLTTSKKPDFTVSLMNLKTRKVYTRNSEMLPRGTMVIMSCLPLPHATAKPHMDPTRLHRDATTTASPCIIPTGYEFGGVVLQHIEEYKVLGNLGQGGYGSVRLARERLTGRCVALKESCVDDDMKRLFFDREMSLLTQLKGHKNIVEIYGVVVSRGTTNTIAMAFAPSDLHREIKKHYMTKQKAPVAKWMRDILCGVCHMHAVGIVHRDLKPANILVDVCGTLKITDFGFGRFTHDPQPENFRVGSRGYYAPEVLLSMRYPDQKPRDMWAIACVLVELSGMLPLFCGKNDEKKSQLEAIFRILGTPDCSWNALRTTCKKMLPERVYRKVDLGPFFRFVERGDQARDLFESLVRYDPAQRITAQDASRHAFVCQ